MSERYISLFSGAGGLDLGLIRAGLKPGIMNDENRAAYDTLRSSMPAAGVVHGDIHDMLNAGLFTAYAAAAHPVLVAGEPPLVGQVSENGTGTADPDGDAPQLFYRFLDVVGQARPEAFLMVLPPVLSGKRWGSVTARLRTLSRDLGYDTYLPVLDGAAYGVPQHRHRICFTGMPRGCRPAEDGSGIVRRPAPSAGTAIRGLPPGTRDIACPAGVYLLRDPVVRATAYSGMLVAGPGRVLNLDKVAPALPAAIGGNKTPVIDVAQLESRAVPWIEGYHKLLRDGSRPEPRFPKDVRMRRLSLRECAALQGLPPDYPLHGASLAQFKLTGSACPPALGEAAGRMILAGLR